MVEFLFFLKRTIGLREERRSLFSFVVTAQCSLICSIVFDISANGLSSLNFLILNLFTASSLTALQAR